ncbi:MAG: hypothetical protein ABI589_09430 [Burkholderiales bacterium]
MGLTHFLDARWTRWTRLGFAVCAAALAGCGGGSGSGSTGNERDSGPQQTTLSVAASDADGDTLSYQWRATAGTIDNRDAAKTVWTLPLSPGLHFAYVTVTDGKGGYAQRQYAVSSDPFDDPAPAPAQARHSPPPVTDFNGPAMRLRFQSFEATQFAVPGAAAQRRDIYLPDVPVQVVREDGGAILFAGNTDVSGEVSLPKLAAGASYKVMCAHAAGSDLQDCGTLSVGEQAGVRTLAPVVGDVLNLRLFGHVGFTGGGVCGTHSEFFQQFASATVQLLQADGGAITAPRRVNRFGDYMVEATVPARAGLRLRVACGSYAAVLEVPASPTAAGYSASNSPIELSHRIPNSRPVITRMVANGPDGNLRGQEITDETVGASKVLPGEDQFLAYKGQDTRLSACRYYRAFGMVRDCDAQGNMIAPVTMEEWKREQQLPPYQSAGTQAKADYLNEKDLNLTRRMTAAAKSRDNISFLVCNHPGPEGQSQREVDEVLSIALAGDRLVACVGMEWSVTPGANDNKPFTKFVTFGPDGSLLASVNLDGRGEKYLPGNCVACHGGSQYNGKFPEGGNPSPSIGARFMPFDTNNFRFGSAKELTEPVQAEDLRRLNELVSATESLDDTEVTPTRSLVQGWYAAGGNTLDRNYVPPAWKAAESTTPGAARFYREVVGTSCRMCHIALGGSFDWDTSVLTPARAQTHVCGGTAALALNASMPNALLTRDRMDKKANADPALAALMRTFLGCTSPLPDPVYPAR